MKFRIIIILFFSCSAYGQDYFDQAENARNKKNWSEAIKNYELAFEAGHPHAAHWLGIFYIDGRGVTKSAVHAAAFFSVAANEGVIDSMVYLADMRLNGVGIAKDCKKAEEWVRKFSKGSIPEAWQKKIDNCKK